MLLKGSCHCGAVHFSVESEHPYPFNLCYCSICRPLGPADLRSISADASGPSRSMARSTSASTGRESKTLATARASVRWNAVSVVNAAACMVLGPAMARSRPSLRVGHRHRAPCAA
jgi:hypothetical protein